ncbi:hypothetical protein [Sphingomonas sp.]|uniref:hypothetical protein n=1 Tax=Sphingomonas sp. TaxID=28214 RepID=UPI002DD6AE73|nr:hypothetical protein [Sphingomonas sp.]
MSARADASRLLDRALRRSAADAGLAIALSESGSRRWASATFAGSRHLLEIRLSTCPTAGAWLEGLPEADLPLRGHLVADLIVTERRDDGAATVAQVEVLTLEDG